MKIFLAADHAGFELKNQISLFLKNLGYEIVDCGAFSLDSADDYPDFIKEAATKVSESGGSFGLVFGKSGAGECMVANKIRGIRAFVAVNEKNVKLAREHNDANIMSIGTDFTTFQQTTSLITLFLKTPFSNEKRHVRRIKKITELENNQ